MTGFVSGVDLVMVSLLQDQSNIKFSSSDTLERDQQDLMKTQGGSISPIQQSDNPGYSCQPYESGVRTERRSSESSHSPSPASPAQTQIHGRYPANQGIHCGKNKFKASFSTEKFRRCSYEESPVGNYDQFLKSSRNPFHPYKRQISEDVFQEAHQALPPEASPFKSHRSIEGFEGLPGSAGAEESESFPTHIPSIPTEQPWCPNLQYSPPGQGHGTQLMFPSGGTYPVTYITSSHYPYQRIAPQSSQDAQQPLFPKPIYSYSILIFMALKNSKTGSLPVSEIYNFMTEHFPYFKTAPDGWKNSVRHNLSLNKCFEKVENKSGNSSRKGCLWALNPAKIDKMQEELQKWKRKDPVAVRKSMAKPGQ
ncbi:forkhead box N1 [Willisornis vidua]|uniref:Forkhead box N1 n=1 Tax=Willisornis vidua TaxID=1566151 RepID=A0ABQ9DBU2_9PASS|nr:forkhead box N1 [Willisornis vidua]